MATEPLWPTTKGPAERKGTTVAALTIYDMCKARDRAMQVEALGLVEKSGGRSGDWHRPA